MTGTAARRWSRRAAGAGAVVAALTLLGCASTDAPPPSSIAVELATPGADALQGARKLWIAGAAGRTGGLATGMAREVGEPSAANGANRGAAANGAAPGEGDPASHAQGTSADVREDLVRAIRQVRGLELAPDRDAADLVLYYEQADRLRCWGCRQPEDLWYWWGLVADRSGRELASLHGETDDGADAAARQFLKAVKRLARSRPRDASGRHR